MTNQPPRRRPPRGHQPARPASQPRPLPREIYLRRRWAAVGILIVIIALIWWGISAALGNGKEPAATPAATTTSTSAARVTTSSTASSSSTAATSAVQVTPITTVVAGSTVVVTPTVTASSAATVAAADKTTCELADLQLTAGTDQANYTGDAQPRFWMTVQNPTKADCKIDLSANVLRFEVYNMATNQRVWSDVDCNAPEDTDQRVFPAGTSRYYEAVWSRTTSAPNQCQVRTPVATGNYYLHAVIGTNASAPIPFNIT